MTVQAGPRYGPDARLDVTTLGPATPGRPATQAGLAGGNGDPAALDLLASGAPAPLLDHC